MKDKKQISATIDQELADWIYDLAEKEDRTNSKMIEILLDEARTQRDKKKEKAK